MVYFEIRDQERTLFEGDLYYITMIWETNVMSNEYFEEKYRSPRNPEYIIKTWKGNLEMIQRITHSNHPKDEMHHTWIKDI